MPRWATWLPLALGVAAVVAGCGTSGGTIDTTDLTKVELSSYQSLPPPFGSAQAVLTSPASLASFSGSLVSHHIGVTGGATANAGCSGGIQYTIVMEWSGGRPVMTLSAYDCGGQVTSNMSGDVSGFLAYVSSLLVATPSGQG